MKLVTKVCAFNKFQFELLGRAVAFCNIWFCSMFRYLVEFSNILHYNFESFSSLSWKLGVEGYTLVFQSMSVFDSAHTCCGSQNPQFLAFQIVEYSCKRYEKFWWLNSTTNKKVFSLEYFRSSPSNDPLYSQNPRTSTRLKKAGPEPSTRKKFGQSNLHNNVLP